MTEDQADSPAGAPELVRLTANSHAQMERFRADHETKVLTILLSDLENSTALQSRLGNVRAAELTRAYRSIFRKALRDVQGQEVETAGDSFLIVFAAPSEGVKYALHVQAAMRRANKETPDLPLARVGIHQGQVVIDHHEEGPKALDVYGLQISTAARIADLGRGGQVLLSRAVFDDARTILRVESIQGLGPISWRNHGPYRFKGIADLYDVCEVGEEGSSPLEAPPAGAKGWPAGHAQEELGWRPASGVTVPGTNWVLQDRLGAVEDAQGLQTRTHEGEFGEVWKAWNPADKSCQVFKFCFRRDRLVALKRESRLLKRLRKYRHPNLVEVYDVTEGDRPPHFLEMEYVEGPSLRQWLAGGPSLNERLEVVAQIVDALDTVHAAGIYHRDIKPSNILLTRREDGRIQAKLTDFGLGAAEDREILHSLESSRLEGVVGTWDYIAPELRKGGKASPQSDLYSLGVALYQVVCGDLHRTLGDWEGQVPSEVLREDIRRCIATDPARRWARASDLANALRGHDERMRRLELEREGEARRQRARKVRGALAAAGALAVAAMGVLLYWWLLPGTVEFDVKPAGARIEIAGKVLTAGEVPVSVELRAGSYEARIAAADYFPQTQGILVMRSKSKRLTLALEHHKGILEAECEPVGSEIEVNGVPYGSRIRNLPLDTGQYHLLAWSNNHFDSQRDVRPRQDQRLKERFWLDRGVEWVYTSPGVQGGACLVADLDGDGLGDIAQNELDHVVIHSSATGEVLLRIPAPASGSRTFQEVDLGGKVGRVIATAKEVPSFGGAVGGLEVFLIRQSAPDKVLWRWQGPRRDWNTPEGAPVHTIADLDGDGVAELAVASRDGVVYILSGATGEKIKEIAVFDQPLKYPFALDVFTHQGESRLLFFARQAEGADDDPQGPRPYTFGCLRLADGKTVWRKDLGRWDSATCCDLDGDGTPEPLLWKDGSWRVLDAATGASRGQGSLPDGRRMQGHFVLADLKGDRAREFIIIPDGASHADPNSNAQSRPHPQKTLAVRWSDGGILWDSPLDLSASQPLDRNGMVNRTPRGDLLLSLTNSLAAVDPKTGGVRWQFHGVPEGVLLADWDGDGENDILVTIRGQGLSCLSAAGAPKWTLRLDVDVRPYALLPDIDGDGMPEILIHRHAALYGVVRGPRTLWSQSAVGPLQATPLVIDADGDGGREIIQLGPWGQGQSMRCLEGRSGAVRWGTRCQIPYNRPPAIADWDGDGRPDVVAIGQMPGMTGSQLVAFRGSDGKELSVIPIGEAGAIYSTPVVGKFGGQGRLDLAVHRWDRKDVVAIDGKSGKFLWRYPTGQFNMGGVGLADLNGDGRDDVVAPSIDGYVHAVNGADGKAVWPPVSIGRGGSRSPPLLYDLTGDGVPDVLVVAQDGAMYVIDGRKGSLIWRAATPGASEGLGRPAVARIAQSTLILAPMGRAGVVAFDFEKRSERWRSPEGHPVLAAPVVADLDHDQLPEVVAGTADGFVLVLDLATGKLLWKVRVGDKPIEADPAVVDLDGDGILDILIAGHDFKITAISGRGTSPARKHLP